MAKSLWDFYDGEPFMENPHVAVVGNPYMVGSIIERQQSGFRKISQKKGRKTVAYRRKARKAAPRRARTRARTRRRHRRNPFPVAGVAINPRRRRHHSRRRRFAMNPRRRRSHRRNPAILGVMLPPLNMIAWGAGGFIAPPMVEGFVSKFLPAEVTSSVLGRYAVKIGSVLGLTWLVKTVMSAKEAFPVALGGSLYVVVSAINEFVPQLTAPPATAPGTAAYRTGMIKAYRGGMISTGIGQYSRPGLAQPRPGLAISPSALLPMWSITGSGMPNPVQADPRFSNSPFAQ